MLIYLETTQPKLKTFNLMCKALKLRPDHKTDIDLTKNKEYFFAFLAIDSCT